MRIMLVIHTIRGKMLLLCMNVCLCVSVCVWLCVFLPLTVCVCTYKLSHLNSPHYDDDKVQHVPAVPDVGVLVHDQAVSNNLHKCLYRENDQEGIFYCFLHRGKGRENTRRGEGGEKKSESLLVCLNFIRQTHCVHSGFLNTRRWGKQVWGTATKITFSLVTTTVGMATGFFFCQSKQKNIFDLTLIGFTALLLCMATS